MSTYKAESDLSRLNRDGASGWVAVDRDVVEVILASKRVHSLSRGAFDPTVLPLMRLWGFREGKPHRPSLTAITRTLDAVGLEHVSVDSVGGRVRYERLGVSLDLGGIAKGYALDVAKRAAIDAGAAAGQLDLGGNLLVFGSEASGRAAIQDPNSRDGVVGVIDLQDVSVATSGGYERYVEIEGKRYGHIIDPRTGYPAEGVASVTVVSDQAVIADALSTACYVMGRDACLEMVEEIDRVEALVLWLDGTDLKSGASRGLGLLWSEGGDDPLD